ncbi:hypothetical protein BDV95DRAFT_222006 [Massariosphaeria phaeospora]|uniref:Uncharacterized protein n=1 Tax=Massariosphaeria phaeospora TaxID=100035 RepID=A0A7C8IH85_9PLEO|nr:hypothetical protein BDV95DRAFT_222006 [Massariosphaeria phaeospora]
MFVFVFMFYSLNMITTPLHSTPLHSNSLPYNSVPSRPILHLPTCPQAPQFNSLPIFHFSTYTYIVQSSTVNPLDIPTVYPSIRLRSLFSNLPFPSLPSPPLRKHPTPYRQKPATTDQRRRAVHHHALKISSSETNTTCDGRAEVASGWHASVVVRCTLHIVRCALYACSLCSLRVLIFCRASYHIYPPIMLG